MAISVSSMFGQRNRPQRGQAAHIGDHFLRDDEVTERG
jgi:hypothetical protein